MGMPAARIGDIFVHDDCIGVLTGGSDNVITEGIEQSRLTDTGDCECDGDVTVATASETVFADDLGCARIGDTMSCGGVIVTGAYSVLIGD